ncbi:MAG: hypothetical protein ACFFAD_02580 [Candidatus Hermodarchaeota archaeon]
MREMLLGDILRILKESKEDNCIKDAENTLDDVLKAIRARRLDSGAWEIERSLRIDLALRAVSIGAEVEDVVDLLTWKDFEGFVASILVENNFRCVESFRKRGTAETLGMEIDVIGVRGNSIVSIDAKMWGIRTGKSSALKTAAEKQKERTKRLCGVISRLAKGLNGLTTGQYILKPVLVTWMVEEVVFHDGVPIVPVFLLNSFLQDISIYEDMIATSSCVYEG